MLSPEMKDKVIHTLERMIAMWEGPYGWCKRALAIDYEGNKCSPLDPTAIKFCYTGIAARVLGLSETLQDHKDPEKRKVLDAVRSITRTGLDIESVVNWNDTLVEDKAEVLAFTKLVLSRCINDETL